MKISRKKSLIGSNLNQKIIKMNIELKEFIEQLCQDLGLNTAHDYDGIETEEDIEIYKMSIRRKIANLKK